MQMVPLTPHGAELLKEELHHLKLNVRTQISKAIAEARAHGDLKENAEYHAAKEQQGFVEARIKEIEAKLSLAQIIDISNLTNNGKVVFGAKIELGLEDGSSVFYQIVGDDEADVKSGKISVNSPIARSLIGKFVGDLVEVLLPGGAKQSYEIISVAYV